MPEKTYFSNKERGLNTHGVVVQPVHKGQITPTAQGSGVYVVNCGGWIKPRVGQTGWRLTCDRIGTAGGYEVSLGRGYSFSLREKGQPVDLLIPTAAVIRIEQIGMVSSDWAEIVVSRVMD